MFPSLKHAHVEFLPFFSPCSVFNTGCSSPCTWGKVSGKVLSQFLGSAKKLHPASGRLGSRMDTNAQLLFSLSAALPFSQPAAWSLITSVCKNVRPKLHLPF